MNDDLRKKLRKRPKAENAEIGVSTGSTLLNLACTDRADVGFVTGRVYLFVGDSSSGKSFLALTSLAEVCNNPAFDGHQVIYDNVENGALMQIKKFFGAKTEARLRAPLVRDGEAVFSRTVEQFYYHVDMAAKRGPFFYVLDSMDALESEDDQEKFLERRKAYEKGKQGDVSGTYGTGKAKSNSVGMRMVNNLVTKTNSIVVIIFQTRQNIGFGAQFNPKTRGGGNAPTFYAAMEFWTSVKGKLRQTIRGKNVTKGIVAAVKVKKNRQTGQEPTVEIPIMKADGIDDALGCVRYLIDWRHWQGSEKRVEAPEFEFEGSPEALADKVVAEGKMADLRDVVQEVWDDVRRQMASKRPPRYQ